MQRLLLLEETHLCFVEAPIGSSFLVLVILCPRMTPLQMWSSVGFWAEGGVCLCWLIRHSLGWLFAGQRAGRGACVGWGGDFTLSTKSLGFCWRDSGWLVGSCGAGFTRCLLLTNLCSTGQVLVRDLEWGKGQRGFF